MVYYDARHFALYSDLLVYSPIFFRVSDSNTRFFCFTLVVLSVIFGVKEIIFFRIKLFEHRTRGYFHFLFDRACSIISIDGNKICMSIIIFKRINCRKDNLLGIISKLWFDWNFSLFSQARRDALFSNVVSSRESAKI